MSKGRMKYVPPSVLEEINMMKKEKNFNGKRADSEAFNEMIKYYKAGQQLERIMIPLGMKIVYKENKNKRR